MELVRISNIFTENFKYPSGKYAINSSTSNFLLSNFHFKYQNSRLPSETNIQKQSFPKLLRKSKWIQFV